MTNVQKYLYKGNSIAFDFGENQKMINATEMAKAFGKLPSGFLRLKQTKDFIDALKVHYADSHSDLFTKNRMADSPTEKIVEVRNGGTNRGTWMHEKLALKFAAWLSPEFELWIFDRIQELLTTGKTQLQPISEAEQILNVINLLNNKVEAQKRQIAEQQPKVEYCETVLESKSTYTISVIAKELGMTAIALNRFLHLNNIQYQTRKGEPWLLRKKYANLGYTDTLTFEYKDKNGNVRTKIQTRWTEKGRQFIHSLMN